MPLVVLEVVEADTSRITEIWAAAFHKDPIHNAMFPKGTTPETMAKMKSNSIQELRDPSIKYMKVVDTDHENEIIAFGKWHIYRQERLESEWNVLDSRDWGRDVNQEVSEAFFAELGARRKKFMAGKPHALLGLLDTDPKHQRRGAGSKLVQWGTDVADEAGLCCYLEASEAGHRLYRSKGFKDVESIEMDLSRWGIDEMERMTCMIRPASEA